MSAFTPRKREQNFILDVALTTVKVLFLTVLIVAVTGTGLVLGVAKAWLETTPELDLNAFDAMAKTTFICDRYGNVVTEYKGAENRVDAEWEELPQYLIDAILAVEDQRFYSHNGVDAKRIVGAFVSNILNAGSQGGSTITQQLIKLTMLTSEQTYKRKLQEAYLALQLEEVLTKEEILLQYCNTIYLGGSNYGVKVAAQDYFGKDLRDLSLRECAMLARIIKNPYGYNPRLNYYTRQTPQVSEDGADYVLGLMLEQNRISQAEYDEAMSQTLHVVEVSASTQMYDHAYYVEYAIYDVVTKMLRKEGLEDTRTNRSRMEQKLRTGGYSIVTSLDPDVQDMVQYVVSNWKNYPKMRYSSDNTYRQSLGNGEYLETVEPQAAVAVMDWSTGELVAIVGGRSTPTGMKQLNRTYQMNMPVGSSIKPLSVYGPAFDLGLSPGSPTINAPIPITGWNTDKGYPSNYGGGGFTGVETLRRAINKSHNTATAWALYMYVGIENSVNYLMRMGVSSAHISATGSGLALGTSGISMIEMAAAYGAIINRGVYQEPYAFTTVYNNDGSVYMNARDVQITRRVFKESTAWMLIDVLEGCVGSGGTGSRAKFGNQSIAGKTGTNSDARGVTFAGFTGYYSCAVWIGHDNYKPLVSSATGGTYAAPLWSTVMKGVYKAKGITENRSLKWCNAEDVGLVRASACGVSGMRTTDACYKDANGYSVSTDYYAAGTQPTTSCNMHRFLTLCTESHLIAGEYCPSEVLGCIYIPDGHPLRNGSAGVVRKYFWAASTRRDATTIDHCTIHTEPIFTPDDTWGDFTQGGWDDPTQDGWDDPAQGGWEDAPEIE